MAGQVTALTEFSTNGDSRTYTTSGHTALKPKLVIQKRRVPTGNQTVVETTVSVVHATVDSDGAVLSSKVTFMASVRYPLNGSNTDISAALVIFRDIVAGDEFGNAVTTQEFLA